MRGSKAKKIRELARLQGAEGRSSYRLEMITASLKKQSKGQRVSPFITLNPSCLKSRMKQLKGAYPSGQPWRSHLDGAIRMAIVTASLREKTGIIDPHTPVAARIDTN